MQGSVKLCREDARCDIARGLTTTPGPRAGASLRLARRSISTVCRRTFSSASPSGSGSLSNEIDAELTQWRSIVGVNPSPSKLRALGT